MNLRKISIGLSLAVLLGAVCITGIRFFVLGGVGNMPIEVLGIMLLTLLLSGVPPYVTLRLVIRTKSSAAQWMLVACSLCYGLVYVAMIALTPIAGVIIVSLLSLQILLPLWIVAYIVDWQYRKKHQPAPSEP